tara:strand:+ start:560 stop:1183 length:624 start_codon:yes stop_codon:yes gene_type:complete
MFNKKAAMFGLDARIALAIFGALSVISGAALYSAIQTAKVEQWRQFFSNMDKAYEQYLLDNGKDIPVSATSSGILNLADLIDNRENLSTWNGPYLSATSTSRDLIRTNMTAQVGPIGYAYAILHKKSDWTANAALVDEVCVIDDADCALWYTIHAGNATESVTLKTIFNMLDSAIDGGDGELKGIVRYNNHDDDYLMYQGIMRRKTS